MDEINDSKLQKKIYEIVAKKPGVYLSKVAEEMNITISLIDKHLLIMEEKGDITTTRKEGFIQYFVGKNKVTSTDRRAQPIRQELYDLLMQKPGLHMSKIAEILSMSTSLAEYHLLQMERSNLIMSARDEKGYYKRYYIKDSNVGVKEKKILSFLRQEQLFKIVLLLIKYQSLKHKDFLKYLDISPSTLSYHLNKLAENNIIELISYGDEKGYVLINEDEIVWTIRRYKLGQIIDGFKDIWKDLNLSL